MILKIVSSKKFPEIAAIKDELYDLGQCMLP